jgi:hypothetical protein
MIKASKAFVTAALAAIFFLGIAGCASQKEPAEQAMAALEQKFAESSAEIQKYLPERQAELQKSIDSLRASMESKDYGDVVTGARAASDDLKRAIGEARVKRAQTLAAMETEWDELVKTMPAMITAMDKKIASQRGRAPQGMTRDDWKQAIADYDAARDTWSKAASEMTRKNFEETVLAARDAKARIAAIMEKVGVQAS